MNVPQLETERLILRGATPADFPAIAALWGDAEVTRYIHRQPLSEEEIWAKFMRAFGHWVLCGFGFWAVQEKASGQLIGETGFLDVRRAITPPLTDTPEVGWAYVRAAWGKGYASEALQAALAWGDVHLGGRRFACLIAPENAASLRVAAKAGFGEPVRTSYKNEPTLIFYREPRPATR